MNWINEHQTQFIDALSSLWPGGWIDPQTGRATEKGLNWLSAAMKFHIDIATEAVREVYSEGQTTKLPPLSAFRTVCNQIAEFIANESRRKRELDLREAPTFTGKELAADESFWDSLLDTAPTPDALEFLKNSRELCRRGALPADIARFTGDVLTVRNGRLA